MFDVSLFEAKNRVFCSCSFTKRGTCLSPFDVWKMTFEYVRWVIQQIYWCVLLHLMFNVSLVAAKNSMLEFNYRIGLPCSSPFNVQKLMFEFIRCLIKLYLSKERLCYKRLVMHWPFINTWVFVKAAAKSLSSYVIIKLSFLTLSCKKDCYLLQG